jgi:predicted ATPase
VRLLPGLARRSGKSLPLPPPVTGGELEQLFAAIIEFLRLTTEGGRTGAQIPNAHLIFIDDLQWADETSLRLFHFIARRTPHARFLLVGAFRYEEIDHTSALQLLLQDLQRDSLHYLQLASLTPDAIHTLTAGMWPKLPEGYRPHVTTLLSQATGGNPLFVTEVLRELAYSPQLPVELPIPESVQNLIRRRLRHLPESCRQVVEAMAVLHGPATPAEAHQVSGRSEEETTTAIELCLRRDLLRSQLEVGRIYYDFKHDLIRQAVLSQLSHVRQGVLHRRAATALAQAATRMAPAARQAMAGRITRHAFAGECFELVFQ